MNVLKSLLVVGVFVLITACGGGGGTSSSESGGIPSNAGVTYQSVASEGELISYTVDTKSLTYSYEIIESAYGKTGVTGSGKMTRNADGTYTPSGNNGKIAVLDSGVLLGTVYEDLNNDGTREVIPVLGVSNPVTSLSEAAGFYNFISRQCRHNQCSNYYGTANVKSDGTWTSCVGSNIAASNYSCQESASGSVISNATGRATLLYNGVVAGSMLIFKDPTTSQKAVLLDLNGKSMLGQGAIFASSQSLPESADGNWTYMHSGGNKGVVTVTGNNFTDRGFLANGTAYGPYNGSFTTNVPWSGFVTTQQGSIFMTTGSGMYVGYFPQSGSISIGLKKSPD